jgi:DNA-binding transcriptional LysR family regulator
MLIDLREADAVISGEHKSARGELAVTAPVGFGHQHVHPIALEFLHEFPEVDLRLLLVDRVVNLLEEKVDLAVRIGSLPDSGMTARHLGEVGMVVCASPAFLERHGAPKHPGEMQNFNCIAWASLGAFRSWLFNENGAERMFPIRVRLTTTLPESALDAAIAGLGVVQLSSYVAAEALRSGQIVRVLRHFEAAPTPVSLVYSSGRMAPRKLRAFLDFATHRLVERLRSVAEIL